MTPAILLLLGVIRHEVWEMTEHGALVWNLCGAVVVSCLVIREWGRTSGKAMAAVCMWWLYEESLVGICSTWRIFDWWQVTAGEQQCTARFGFKFGALSLVLLGLIIYKVARNERLKLRD